MEFAKVLQNLKAFLHFFCDVTTIYVTSLGAKSYASQMMIMSKS